MNSVSERPNPSWIAYKVTSSSVESKASVAMILTEMKEISNLKQTTWRGTYSETSGRDSDSSPDSSDSTCTGRTILVVIQRVVQLG